MQLDFGEGLLSKMKNRC